MAAPEQLLLSSFYAKLQARTIENLSLLIATLWYAMKLGETMRQNALEKIPNPVNVIPMLTGSQIRAARALLRWSGKDLAERSGVSYPALQRAESTDGLPNMQTRNLAAIKAALEAGGVVFLDPGQNKDGGPGVRLRD